MKEFNEIDQRIQAKMDAWEPKAPSFVADRVMASIRKEPRTKPPLLVWYVLIASMLAVGIAVTYSTVKSSNTVKESQLKLSPASATKTSDMAELGEHNGADNTNVASPAVANGSSLNGTTAAQGEVKTPQIAQIQTTNQSAKHAKRSANSSAIGGELNSNITTITSQLSAVGLSENSNLGISKSQAYTTQTNTTLGTITSAGQSAEITQPSGAMQQSATNPQSAASLEASATQQVNQKSVSSISLLTLADAKYVSRLNATEFKLPKSKIKPFVLDDKSRIKRYADAGRFDQLRFIELYGGARYSHTFMDAKSIEFEDYATQRKATERADFGWEAGVRATFLMNRFWVLQTGLQLAQNTRAFHYDDIIVRKTAMPGAADSIYMTGVVKYKKVYHRIHTLDLPVSFGMEIRNGLHGLRVSAGAELNLGVKSRGGMMFDIDGDRAVFTATDARSLYKPWIGGRVIAQTQFFKSFNGRDRFFIEPAISFQPFSGTRTDYPIAEKPLVGSLRLGYAKSF
jgi:hypothetical protein